MTKIYYKNNLDLNYDIIFIPKLKQAIINYHLDCFLQESFINCFELNDIDLKEDDSYMNYLGDKSILILRESSGTYLCFGTIDLKPSLEGVGFSLYLSPKTNKRRFKYIFHILMTSFLRVIVNESEFINYRKYIYFDVASLVIYKWTRIILPNLKKLKIKDQYTICYTDIDEQYINNIILKNTEIYKC